MINLVSPVSVVSEPLEADDEDLRQHPDVQLLCGLLELFAPRTVPHVLFRQLLLQIGKHPS